MKVIFDSNVFDDLLSGKLDLNILKNIQICITHIQRDELNKCTNENKKDKLIQILEEVNPEILPTESFCFNISRFGMAKLSDGKTFDEIKKGNIKNTEDALIGEVALKKGLVLITNDKGFRKKIEKLNGKVFNVDEFKKILQKSLSAV